MSRKRVLLSASKDDEGYTVYTVRCNQCGWQKDASLLSRLTDAGTMHLAECIPLQIDGPPIPGLNAHLTKRRP